MQHNIRPLSRRAVMASGTALAAATLIEGPLARPARAAAPLLGPAQPSFYRFKLGEFEVTTLLDAAAMLDGPWPIIGEGQPEADIAQLMRQYLLPEKKFQPGFTPTLVNTGNSLILFDTGNGETGFVPRPNGGLLASLLGPAGFTPEAVDLVVITHGHLDHIGGLVEGGKPLFPNARYAIGQVEYDFWASDERLTGSAADWAKLFWTNVVRFADRMTFLKNGAEVASGITAVDAPGHTPGHMAFNIESAGKRLLLWADCAHHSVASLARPDWHVSFDMDKEAGAATRKRIYDMAASDRVLVQGYHMPFPSLGYVERLASGYRWIPLTYQQNL